MTVEKGLDKRMLEIDSNPFADYKESFYRKIF